MNNSQYRRDEIKDNIDFAINKAIKEKPHETNIIADLKSYLYEVFDIDNEG